MRTAHAKCPRNNICQKGTWGFTSNRPAWATPIHQLMAANHVTIFFQGHDHIWVRKRMDGVIYQTLPEPADPNDTLYNADAFLSGDKLPGRKYTRYSTVDLRSGVWSPGPSQTDIPGSGGMNAITDLSPTCPVRFYRVDVRLP